MRTYQELFHTREFTPLFLASAGQNAAQTVGGLALGILVFERTDSALLSSLAMFGPALAQLLGAVTVLSAADRLPPRAAMTGLALLFGAGTALQAVPGLPLGVLFAVLLGLGLAGSVGGGVRYGLLNEVLAGGGYLLGRSVLNVSVGVLQICGFAAGGALVAALSARGTLLLAAGLHLLAALVARYGLSARPPRGAGRASVAETWRTNARLWSSAPRRYVYLALWVPNGLIVGVESLYVPYAPGDAGLLFAAGALGMLAGDVVAGRFLPAHRRHRPAVPLCVLLAAPYLLFAFRPALPLALALVALATFGYASGLLLQDRLIALTPDGLSGQALGLHSCGMLAMQGIGAAAAGAVAELTSPATGMAATAGASLAATLLLAPGLRGAGAAVGRTGTDGVDG
ncbi:putative MFS family arabinose efflux permease [Streptomyces sp. 1114.5]|uniref:MFS transporter n=1 Tax=Streptomyces sp. 1114.5 TaxID=1938830 RepID=UPI000EB27FFD|nr:MFS transporter [Streptomyces sp. 1114.5]RKT09677.1 putative MFS family arabinose efflux permease [Streptomyces sp. 1114.5]